MLVAVVMGAFGTFDAVADAGIVVGVSCEYAGYCCNRRLQVDKERRIIPNAV